MAYETWTVDGVNLSTLAYDIFTYEGLDDVPEPVGEDLNKLQDHGIYPGVRYYAPGRKLVSMMVNTVRTDGTTAATEDGRRGIFYDNLDALLRIFYRRKLLTVQRTLPSGAVRQAQCRVVNAIRPELVGLSAGRVTFDLQLPYSFWEDVSSVTSATIPVGTNVEVLALAGATAPMTDLEFDVKGPVTNPIIRDPETSSWVQINAVIANGATVTLKNADQTVVGTSLSNITHSGDPKWLSLYPSPTGVRVTLEGSGGTMVIRGKRKYLR